MRYIRFSDGFDDIASCYFVQKYLDIRIFKMYIVSAHRNIETKKKP